jgi:hypothetical protein
VAVVKAITLWILLAVVIIAASVKSYSLYATTLDASEMMPAVIAGGQAHAPNQYRLLVPLLWRATTSIGITSQAAERGVVIVSILFCYAALAAALYRSSLSVPVTSLCIIAFYGAAASGFWFRYRDTFFEVGFTCIGMCLVLAKRPAWPVYSLLSAVAALNRETWLFSLIAAAISRSAHAVGLGSSRSRWRDLIGIGCAALLAAGVLAAVRTQYGVRAYHYELWQYASNVRLLLITGSVRGALGQAVWFAGSGIFLVWAIFALTGLARHVPFVVGFTGSLLVVSFLVSNWSETRIFIPAYAVMLVSISGGLAGVSRFGFDSAQPSAATARASTFLR